MQKFFKKASTQNPRSKNLNFWYKVVGLPAVIILAYLFLDKEADPVKKQADLMVAKATETLKSNPKKAEKLAEKAQLQSGKAENIEAKVAALLLRIEAAFDAGDRTRALEILKSVTNRAAVPGHEINATYESQAILNLGLARILFKNNLPEQAVEKAKLSMELYVKAGMLEKGAERMLAVGNLMRQRQQPRYAAAVYNLVATFYRRHSYLARAAELYELAADSMLNEYSTMSYELYVNALNTLTPVRNNTNENARIYERVRVKIQNLPAGSAVYD